MKTGFGITFSDGPVTDLEPGEIAIRGVITLGVHRERFVADVSYWSKGQYEMQWVTALQAIVSEKDRSALITSMHHPSKANFVEWWPMWRERSEIVFHNQLLPLNQLSVPFDPSYPDQFVGERVSINEDGAKISEWHVKVEAVRNFLARNSARLPRH